MIKSLLTDLANITNDVIGVSSDYFRKGESEACATGIKIIVDNSKEVKGDFGAIAGYEPEAAILKSDIARVKIHDTFIQDGITYRINFIVRETTGKTYVDIVKIA
jgi:hypothetical protein